MSMVYTGVALAIVSAAAAGYSAYQTTKANNASAKYNAAVAERNAKIAEMKARDATAAGKLDEKAQRRKTALMLSSQRTAAAASGVEVDSGSMFDITQDTSKYGELDALTIRRNAAMNAWGFRNQGADFKAQSTFELMQVRNASGAATTSFLGSLGSSAGTISSVGGSRKTSGATA